MGEDKKFKDAVEFAKNKIKESTESSDFELKTPEKFLERVCTSGFSDCSFHQALLKDMIKESNDDREIRRILKLGIAHTIEKGFELPDIAKIWLQKHLKGELPKLAGAQADRILLLCRF